MEWLGVVKCVLGLYSILGRGIVCLCDIGKGSVYVIRVIVLIGVISFCVLFFLVLESR